MNVIFLDIDGVLNCEDTPNPRKFPYIVDARLLSLLKGLLARTGANAVSVLFMENGSRWSPGSKIL